jgi:hypothetical protein
MSAEGAPDASWGRALAAAAVLGGAAGPEVVARLGGAAGEVARRALGAWGALPSEARARAVIEAAQEARAPRPAGVARVDRGWLEAALPGDPRARAAWEAGRADAVGVWWSRGVTARWVALPAEDARAALAAPADLARWPAPAIVAALRRVSLAVIAHVTLEAGDPAVARLAASVVDGAVVIEVARRLRGEPAVRDALGPVRAAAARVRGVDPATELGLGAAAIGRRLDAAGDDGGAQVRLVLAPAIARLVTADGLDVPWPALRRLIEP